MVILIGSVCRSLNKIVIFYDKSTSRRSCNIERPFYIKTEMTSPFLLFLKVKRVVCVSESTEMRKNSLENFSSSQCFYRHISVE